MPSPGPHDDTCQNYEQFEQAQLVKDRDATGADTTGIDNGDAADDV